jgi:colanic acid/amylovoran biosynthesis glycosyltransferase
MPIVASYCTTFLKPEMRHIYRQVTHLSRYETFILTRERLGETEFPFPEVEVIPRARKNFLKRFYLKYIRQLPPVYYRGELQEVIKILKRRPADVMHIYFGHTGVHLLPFIESWKGAAVVSFHGMDIQPRPDQPGYDSQMARLLQVTPLILARSQSLMERLVALGCPRDRLRLNRTGIPLDAFPFVPRTPPPDAAWHFVQACRLIPKKGLLTALRAFATFHRIHPGSRFTIAGDGPQLRELQSAAAELGIASAVEFAGFLSQEALAALYHRAHLFVHPSEMPPDQNQEGVPNAMLEAMATGLPVAATRHGGIPEAVCHGETGWLVPERDHEALATALFELTGAGYSQFAAAAAASVRAQYTIGAATAKLEQYYDEAREIAPHLNRP